jgi:hypothetical protein
MAWIGNNEIRRYSNGYAPDQIALMNKAVGACDKANARDAETAA